MNLINNIKKFEKIRFSVVLIIVGLIISVIAGIMITKPDGNYAKINATIESIKETVADDDSAEYSVTVSYNVNGTEYKSELGAYQSGWHKGDVLECEYNVDNPEEIRKDDGKVMSIVICAIGAAAVVFGIIRLVKDIKTPAAELSQYDRVKESQIDSRKAEEIQNSNEPLQDFVFHYTGKLNQSFIMKDQFGKPVYEVTTNTINIVKDTEYEFKNLLTGKTSKKMISHTTTVHAGGDKLGMNIKSSFNIDGIYCWDVLASQGYGFKFSLNGVKSHYDVKHMGVDIGFAELAGTGVMNEKYKDNPLGKIPTNGIFTVRCPKSEIEAMFLICFCITKTEFTIN